jgi:hypothetical protein
MEVATGQSLLRTHPLAKLVRELCTPQQLGEMRALAREAGVDPDEECSRVTGMACRIEELSRAAAAEFIEHLKGMGE